MRQLADRLAHGDEGAFEELYDLCADRLRRFLLLRTGCPQQAADLLQTTFLRVVKSRKRFSKVEQPVAYVFQIARNEATRVMRRDSLRVSTTPITGEQLWQWADDPTCQLEDAETIAMGLSQLTDEDRELIELKIYAGLTFGEIAQATGRPQGSVATRYRRALESLRPWMTRQFRHPEVEDSKS